MPNASDIPAYLAQLIDDAYDGDAASRVVSGLRDACRRPVTLRANTLKATADEVASALGEAGIGWSHPSWYADAFVLDGVRERAVWDLDIYREGKVYLQSLSSMMPPLALAPRDGADILDMCAAPGGKTSQIVALSRGLAHVTACEMNAARAERLAYNLDKLGCKNVQVMRVDARRLDEFFAFDQILLDAPCTGAGTVRAGDERAASRITERLLAKVVKSQRALLDRALTVLKPGGTLIYSTCSVLPEENELAVAAALKRHRDCEVAPVAWEGLDLDADDAPQTLPCALDGALAVCPSRAYEGFFIAAIKKAARRR